MTPPLTSSSSLEGSCSSFDEEQLRIELEELRTSTRTELLKSWAEIEVLEDEKEQVVDRNMDLICELESSREREQALQLQVQSLQQRLGEEPRDQHQHPSMGLRAFLGRKSSSRSSLCSSRSSGASTCMNAQSFSKDYSDCADHQQEDGSVCSSSINPRDSDSHGLGWSWAAKTRRTSMAATAEKERIESEFMYQLRDLEQEKKELVATWETKLNCSQSVLESIEQSRQIQGETLVQLQNQLELQDNLAQERGTELRDCICSLRKKLHEKRKYIKRQQDEIKEYRDYINDLTAELEKTAVIKFEPEQKQPEAETT
jgi:chromosome segregation ATPase